MRSSRVGLIFTRATAGPVWKTGVRSRVSRVVPASVSRSSGSGPQIFTKAMVAQRIGALDGLEPPRPVAGPPYPQKCRVLFDAQRLKSRQAPGQGPVVTDGFILDRTPQLNLKF